MNWKKIAATILCALSVQGAAFAAPIPLRGIVEGFYGKPWTQEQRIDMMAFCEAHRLNAYIYAPKDDPYHREKWREPYPEAQIKKIFSENEVTILADLNTGAAEATAWGCDFTREWAETVGID